MVGAGGVSALIAALVLLALGLMLAAAAIWQSRPRGEPLRLPGWPPKDWRAFLALVASVGGSAALTLFAGWLVWIVWRGGWPTETAELRLGILGKALLLSLGGALVVLISLGLAINRRSITVGREGVSIEGGEPPEPPSKVVTTTKTEVQP